MLLELYLLTQGQTFQRALLGLVLPDETLLSDGIQAIHNEIKAKERNIYQRHRWWNLYTKPFNAWQIKSNRDPWIPLVQRDPGQKKLANELRGLGVVGHLTEGCCTRILVIGVPLEQPIDLGPAESLSSLVSAALEERPLALEEPVVLPPLHYSIEVCASIPTETTFQISEQAQDDLVVRYAEVLLSGTRNRALGIAKGDSPLMIIAWEQWERFQAHCATVLDIHDQFQAGRQRMIERLGPFAHWKSMVDAQTDNWAAFQTLVKKRQALLDQSIDAIAEYIGENRRKPRKLLPKEETRLDSLFEKRQRVGGKAKKSDRPSRANPAKTRDSAELRKAPSKPKAKKTVDPSDQLLEATIKRLEQAWTTAPIKRHPLPAEVAARLIEISKV